MLAVFLILVTTIGKYFVSSSRCDLDLSTKSPTIMMDGDVILGGLMQLNLVLDYYNEIKIDDMRRKPSAQNCFIPSLQYFRHISAFVFAVEEINKQPDLLPNITLGFQIYDTCVSESRAIETALTILSGQGKIIPNYSCNVKHLVAAFIGHHVFSSTFSTAIITGIYRYPQITYGLVDPVFNNRIDFPSLFQMAPSEQIQSEAFALLLHHFGWRWVGIVSSDDESNQRKTLDLQDAINKTSFSNLDPAVYDVDNFRVTHYVYAAVYAIAHALHDIFLHSNHKDLDIKQLRQDWQPWTINHYLRKVRFETPGGEEIYFAEEENAFAKFDIINYIVLPNNTIKKNQVGHFNSTLTQGLQIFINDSAIQWRSAFTQTPRSVCSESCPPGFRKAPQKGRPKCCYDCVPCSEGEISNGTDMANCLKCPDDRWPDVNRVLCIPRSIEFLSYQDQLGEVLVALAAIFSLLTVVVLGIFIKYRHTAIVKANNQNLSYVLLVSLMMCFLCSLLFIGRPMKMTCLIRQAAFGIMFTIAVSSVLAKNMTVVIAFNAMKPNSKLRKWVGTRIPSCIVLLCSLGEVLICIVWWILSPPFPDYDTHSEQGKMILQCNEGSSIMFYLMVSYIGFLAFFCFCVAFIARKLPDTFNEAQYITLSMLVFCSVWVSFIPAYLSTKGKYTVAVEIFAILASASGLLCCIFIPKCHTILIRPELNSKECLIKRK
ncbi:vomeronasal type-2 receptor 26-like [Discoglossus pictus]